SPGSRASTPTWPPPARPCCWPAAISSTTSWKRPISPTSGSPAPARCARPTARPVTGYTGGRWRPGSPFAGPAWEPLYVSGYAGHAVQQVEAAAGSRVLADLVELTGDLTDAATATASPLGPAIVLTGRTAYVA